MSTFEKSFPRVLIISPEGLNRGSATGITLANLFEAWPHDKLAQIIGDASSPDSSICINSYPFSSDRIAVIRAVKSLRAWITGMRTGSTLPAVGRYGISGGAAKGSVLASFADSVPFRIPQDLMEWVANFDPQVIYSPLGSIRMMRIALQLSQRFDIPIVPHFMDDWPSTVYAHGAQYLVLRHLLRRNLGKILSRAPFGLTICEDMSEEYARRHGMRFEAFMNCVGIPELQVAQTRSINGEVVFGYVGGLHLNRWKSLRDVAIALQAARDDGCAVWLDVFAPETDISAYRSEFDGFSVVRKMGSLAYSEVGARLQVCDVLVHVESFLPEDSLYTRLSVSTKIPQYMAQGKPILAYGPASLSSIAYVDRNHSGVTVTKDDEPQALLDSVRMLVERPELRDRLGKAGRDVALRNHDATHERSRLVDLLAEPAGRVPVFGNSP